MNSKYKNRCSKAYLKTQLLALSFVLCVAISPPAKAQVYDAEIILQMLMQAFNNIMEVVNEVGFALEQYYERLGGMVEQNAQQQSTEIISSTIAEQTKILGTTEYEMQFMGARNIVSGGKTFKVGSISSTGCFRKQSEKSFKDVAEKSEEFKVDVTLMVDEIINSNSSEPEQYAEIAQTIKGFNDVNNGTLQNVKSLNAPSLSPADATESAKVAGLLVNKRYAPEDADVNNWMDSGESVQSYYKRLTETVSSVYTNRFASALEVGTGANETSTNKMNTQTVALANSFSHTKATSFKVGKGVMSDVVENAYRQLDLRIQNLNELKEQEKLYSVMALKTLNDMHDEITRGNSK